MQLLKPALTGFLSHRTSPYPKYLFTELLSRFPGLPSSVDLNNLILHQSRTCNVLRFISTNFITVVGRQLTDEMLECMESKVKDFHKTDAINLLKAHLSVPPPRTPEGMHFIGSDRIIITTSQSYKQSYIMFTLFINLICF